MTVLKKINTSLRANPLLYMASSAMIALTIQFIGLELHKRAQQARERKAQAIAGGASPDLALSTEPQSTEPQAATYLQYETPGVQLRPSR